jgi:hypothetical protein|tara:strand:- start:2643 stop:3047 length:405 start_codon:yes stop_codon:yes gene_type:complete
MLKKLIDKLFSQKISEENIECAIDEQIVDCVEIDEDPYVGVVAPVDLCPDEWFSSSYGQTSYDIKHEKEFAGNYQGPLYAPYTAVDAFKKESIGDDGMHQKMYDIATQSGKTTVQLNPIGGSENFQGGSENVHR